MKQIKFNLFLNGEIIRSIEGLRSNFNLDDLYSLYKKGILQKWLDLQGEKIILDNIIRINSDDIETELEGLLTSFGYDSDTTTIEMSSHIYKRIHQKELTDCMTRNSTYDKVIAQYHIKYEELKVALRELVGKNQEVFKSDRISSVSEEVEKMKSSSTPQDKAIIGIAEILAAAVVNIKYTDEIREKNIVKIRKSFEKIMVIINGISEHYMRLFELDVYNFFKEFIEDGPIVVMACLINEDIRSLMMNHTKILSILEKTWEKPETLKTLTPYMKKYEGNTEGMWKYLGNPDKKYLVFSVSKDGMKVGRQLDLKLELDHQNINGKYLVLDGLTFKSNSDKQFIYYLEV
ncbi:hypothetical protein [Exiguobacterium acetylicum]|uniref:hypothetical protein n=1 Tax=Exiguobacterium acetylicum TaxID=41170 RepID=UPI001EE1EEC2|nr:hypothetical protein [Exiguobacterium acetylicum]UKS57865.1 hypothetical protein K6T22_16645 [Exiguobacterium acetylicum]